jgi:hypothetical protein
MTVPHIPPVDAELALAEVQARREQVVGSNLVPTWFWRSLGGLMILFVAGVESHVRWLVVASSVVYAIGLATLILLVIRRSPVQVRPELLGLRGGVAIGGFAGGLVVVGVGLGLGLEALGVPFPATVGVAAVAVGLAVGGPRLMAYLRRLMLSRPLAGS